MYLTPTLLSFSIRQALDVDLPGHEAYLLAKHGRLDQMHWLATLRANAGSARIVAKQIEAR